MSLKRTYTPVLHKAGLSTQYLDLSQASPILMNSRNLINRHVKQSWLPFTVLPANTKHFRTNAFHQSCAATADSIPVDGVLSELAPIATRYLRRLEKLQEGTLSDDERVQKLGRAYHDEYSALRAEYRTPKHPIVLCHGLLGFDSMRIGEIEPLGIPPLAVIHYWKGVKEALEANGNEVFITRVPRTATVEERAEILARQIQDHFGGRSINLIGHSMVSELLICDRHQLTD